MRTRFAAKNIVLYVIGLVFVAGGVVLSFRTGFGGSPGDTLTSNIARAANLSLGAASLFVCTFYILLLALAFKTWKFLFLFVQVFLFSPLVDLFDLVILAGFEPEGWMRYLTFTVSALALPFGCALLIRSTLPAGIYDELMFLTAHVTKLKPAVARTLNEMLVVLLAILVGFATGDGFGSVGLGSVVYAFSIGGLIKGFLYLYDKLFPGRKTQ